MPALSTLNDLNASKVRKLIADALDYIDDEIRAVGFNRDRITQASDAIIHYICNVDSNEAVARNIYTCIQKLRACQLVIHAWDGQSLQLLKDQHTLLAERLNKLDARREELLEMDARFTEAEADVWTRHARVSLTAEEMSLLATNV